MNEHSSEYDSDAYFIHAFTSPITAMRGALDLLHSPARTPDDPLTQSLLATVERNLLRLSGYLDILLKHHSLRGQQIEIMVPLGLLGIGAHATPAAAPASTAAPAAALAAPALEAAHAAANNPPPADTSLLLIGAFRATAPSVVAQLQQLGYHLSEVEDGVAGIDSARDLRPDMILVESELPNIGAQQIVRVLREDPDTKTIPLLLASLHLPAEQHNDTLWLGAPVQSTIRRIEQALAAARAADSQTPTLLIIDDDADIQRILMLRLQQDGFRVVQAMNGAQGLMAAQKQTFDLIILDLLLPDIDGFSVLGALRARNATATTPILLLSARDSAPEKVRGLQLGADDYVTKPFSPAELQARVRATLRRFEREAGANPSTRLPGNTAIERTLRRRIELGIPFAVCYADIDNFKAYNDTYSFLKGDAVIHQTANVLMEAVAQQGNYDDFVGHIGGDDFVVITTPERAAAVAGYAIRTFDLLSPLFYDAATRARGYIDAKDRQGRPMRFPFVSLSIGIVSTDRYPIQHVAEVAQRSVEPKKLAKEHEGSVFIFEE